MNDDTLEMRCISCWVLSRYSAWLFESDYEHCHTLFHSSLVALCGRLLDTMPKAQAAACSALCILSEIACDELVPYLNDIFTIIQRCFPVYGVKSTMHLIDLIGTIADSVGNDLAVPELSVLYLPYLIHRLRVTEDNDMYIFPILECLTSVTSAAGLEMLPYTSELINRCLHIINNTIQSNQAVEEGNMIEDDAPVKDFAICCIDVLAGLCEGLGEKFTEYMNDNNSNTLINLILTCAQDQLADLRQSAVLLIGELVKSTPTVLPIHTIQTRVIDIILANLADGDEHPAVCSNAIWALGEVIIRYGGTLVEGYLGRVTNILIHLMQQSQCSHTLRQNIGITFGRLALTNTKTVRQIDVLCMLCILFLLLFPLQ